MYHESFAIESIMDYKFSYKYCLLDPVINVVLWMSCESFISCLLKRLKTFHGTQYFIQVYYVVFTVARLW